MDLTFKTKNRKRQQGYIALTSVIIVSLLLLTVVTALSSVNYFSRYNILENEYKDRSFALAEGCLDYVLGRLAGNFNYNFPPGGETVNLGGLSCQVVSVVPAGLNRLVSVRGVFPQSGPKKSYTNLMAEARPDLSLATFYEQP